MTASLNGKTAIVTGGARGIGAAIAKRLAADGANVVITYSKSKDEAEKLVAALPGKAKAYKADAADVASLPAFAAQVVKDFGGIDILVNNAGVMGSGMIGSIDYADYEHTRRINQDAVFALTNAVVPQLKSGARIINIGSILGERAIFPGISVYNATKFAVAGLTRSWAKDLGPQGILVNAVQPGSTATEMNPEDGEGAEAQRSQIAIGRFIRPEEIAGAVAFFAGPDSTGVTGVTLNVDGGANA